VKNTLTAGGLANWLNSKGKKEKAFWTNKIFSHFTKLTVMSNAYACELTSQEKSNGVTYSKRCLLFSVHAFDFT